MRRAPARIGGALLVAAAALAAGCATTQIERAPVGKTQRGVASWYGPDFQGLMTASGEIFDTHRFTAAHNTLPFGTVVEVTNLENGRTTRVRINDRGPFVKHRIIDLTYAAAQELDMLGNGTARVELRVLPTGTLLPEEPALAAAPRYTVQVGAFADPQRARALAEELKARYPEAEVRGDGTWNRVQVGSFTDRDLAEEIRKELVDLGFAALVVVLH